MKRFLLSIGLGLWIISSSTFTQAQVSTSVEKKSVLLEEYTGSGCGNCPDGARMASVIKDVCQDKFYIMAIHAGHYAEPISGGLDLRTPYGDSLLSNAGNIGFPAGSINRIPHEGILNMSRALWQEKVEDELQEDAEVNMYVSAEVNAKTRELKVRVEWYYPEEMEIKPHYLHVALLQDEIIGFQNGAGASYAHQHVLRDMFTGFWGDTITDMEPGKVYTKEFVKNLPEKISGVDLDVRYLEVIAFMTKARDYVMNVAGAKPKVTELQDDVKVTLSSLDLGVARYGYAGFPVVVRNYQNDTIEKLSFAIGVNGESETVDVDCNISPYGKGELWIPVSEYVVLGTNEVSIEIKQVNTVSYSSNSVKYDFSSPVLTKSGTVILDMRTDLHGEDITYAVKNRKGDVLQEKGPFEEGIQHSFTDTIRLDAPGIYAIEFLDYWRDGWKSEKNGSYKIKDSEGTILAQNYSVTGYRNLVFFEIPEDLSNSVGEMYRNDFVKVFQTSGGVMLSMESGVSVDRVSLYDITGRRLMTWRLSAQGTCFIDYQSAVSGCFFVEIWGSFGRMVEKIWLKH